MRWRRSAARAARVRRRRLRQRRRQRLPRCGRRPRRHVHHARQGRSQAGLRARRSCPPAFPSSLDSGIESGPHRLTVAGAAAAFALEVGNFANQRAAPHSRFTRRGRNPRRTPAGSNCSLPKPIPAQTGPKRPACYNSRPFYGLRPHGFITGPGAARWQTRQWRKSYSSARSVAR